METIKQQTSAVYGSLAAGQSPVTALLLALSVTQQRCLWRYIFFLSVSLSVLFQCFVFVSMGRVSDSNK